MSKERRSSEVTRNEEGRIIQLDFYVPEVKPREVVISLNLALFTLKQPLRGGVFINQHLQDPDRISEGFMQDCLCREDDKLELDDGYEVNEIADSGEILVINQHIGVIGTGGMAIAACTFDIREAREEARVKAESMKDLSLLMRGISYN